MLDGNVSLPEGRLVMRLALAWSEWGGQAVVLVTGEGVAGTALWRGSSVPTVSTDVDVELEVPWEVDWREIVIAGDGGRVPVHVDGELLLRGVVADLDQDGVLTLRVAGSLVLVETAGEPPPHVVGREVTMLVRSAEIYPTGL